MTARLAVLASGNGTNLQAILDAIDAGRLDASVALVVSDREDAFALERARRAGVERVTFLRPVADRDDYDALLAGEISRADPDLVVLAGFMRILGSRYLDALGGRTVNLHPALPGAHPGLHAIERSYAAIVRGEADRGGCMVHRVIGEVDAGEVLGVREVVGVPGETLEEFAARVHEAEHVLLVEAIVATSTLQRGEREAC